MKNIEIEVYDKLNGKLLRTNKEVAEGNVTIMEFFDFAALDVTRIDRLVNGVTFYPKKSFDEFSLDRIDSIAGEFRKLGGELSFDQVDSILSSARYPSTAMSK